MFSRLLLVFLSLSAGCFAQNAKHSTANAHQQTIDVDDPKYAKAYFASGCFWCVEAVFESVEGVAEAISGYAGGSETTATYDQVSSGTSNHAEAVEVIYDPKKISYEKLLVVFFGSQDPTTLNQQGPDRGRQYRSAIFYQSDKEKMAAEKYIAELTAKKVFKRPIVTTLEKYAAFYPAEQYHQNFERNNPNHPYVKAISIPRLNRFKAKFPELLKDE